MKADARLLVATEVVSDAVMIRKLLLDEFSDIVVSTDPERAVQDFEQHRPDVLILAFNNLEKAERYYLGLYRLSAVIHAVRHHTLILCNKDDLKRVYELCRKEYFDDYILFWPIAYDVSRLHMAIHHALRQMADTETGSSGVAQIAVQARQVAELESQLEQYSRKGGQCMAVASQSLHEAEQAIGAALDSFSSRLSDGVHTDLVEVRDRAGFRREFDRLKTEQVGKNFEAVAAAVQPVRAWAGSLRDDLAPQLESARALKSLAERVRPIVLVVDDDEFQHKLLEQMLAGENLELIFATSCTHAFATLRKRRPDIILMDVNLPDIDGVNATRRIKAVEQFAGIPVIMITGMSEKDIVVESCRAGASDFVVKPISKDVLSTKLHKYLGGSAAARTFKPDGDRVQPCPHQA